MADILWVEDEADKIYALVKPLEKDGHNITVTKDREDAFRKIKSDKIDLIIFDIIIPSGITPIRKELEPYEGIILLKNLKENNINIPIIILTVVNDEDVLNEARNFGAKKILIKGPLLPSELKKEVDEILGINK